MNNKSSLILEGLSKIHEEDKWVTMNGTHVLVDGDGNIKDEKLKEKIKGGSGSKSEKKIDTEEYQKDLETKIDSRAPFRNKDYLYAKTEEGKKVAKRNVSYAKKGFIKDLDKFKFKKLPARATFSGDDKDERKVELSITSNNKKAFKSTVGKPLVTVLKSMGFEQLDPAGERWSKNYAEDDED